MSYLKFLNLAQAVRSLPSFPSMDSCEEVLLNTLARKWDVGQQVTVVEAMNMLPDTSPSTVHRRLKTLRKKKFIALEGDQIDNRIKYVIATPLSKKYLSKMEECLVKAVG